MDMLPVGGDHVVAGIGGAQGTHRHRLLAGIEMEKSTDTSLDILFRRSLLEVPRQLHVVEALLDQVALHVRPAA